MDLSGLLDLFGYSIYSPEMAQTLEQCGISHPAGKKLKLYDSLESPSGGLSLWFWWKEYYREQIAEPQGTVEPDGRGQGSQELVFYEVRFTPEQLDNVPLPFGLRFPATPDSVLEAMGRKPFSKTKNYVGESVWTYYEDRYELLVIFDLTGTAVRCFKMIALTRKVRQKIDFLENLKEQKPNIQPERIPEIEALLQHTPVAAWRRRMKSGDTQFTSESLKAAEPLFADFLEAVCKATARKNPKSIYTAVTKATKAFNKFARNHPGVIETEEREEIVIFFNQAVKRTGFDLDPAFDLTEEHRAW
ncbi:hypothetical protein [Rubinisphaera brasiliensis]|uniref:Uncharacterized protein n=1 Tax=Rubinisphaera brasiliensis (strain ATCC 49424 / DSM 5305 / JCM 21570 / IAM 15109 / NBRC 103401 / IFAM 1448) TaxID=756272 RepID=F0SK74_RUBBR|nr:hypothetical protein [Rubinisphaera brasiliensis]ADY59801.1 hypothetical protein Plabr_2199 [Rubinisphaera brasiliensis DSM 5305]